MSTDRRGVGNKVDLDTWRAWMNETLDWMNAHTHDVAFLGATAPPIDPPEAFWPHQVEQFYDDL